MSADLSRLHPSLRELIAQFPAGWVVVSATRTYAEQLEIAAWGRTKKNPHAPNPAPYGKKATNAVDPATSAHVLRDDGYSHAIDVRPGGTTEAHYGALKEFVELRGFVSGATFKVDGAPDWPHVETSFWRSVPCTPPSQRVEFSDEEVQPIEIKTGGALVLVAIVAIAMALKG